MNFTLTKYTLAIFCVLSITVTNLVWATSSEINVVGIAETKVEPNQFPLIFEIKNSLHNKNKLSKRQESDVSEIVRKIERDLENVDLETLYYSIHEKPESETLPAYEVDYDAVTSIQVIVSTHKDYERLLSLLSNKKVDRIQTSSFYFKDKTDVVLTLEKQALENARVKATALLSAFPNAKLGNPLRIDVQNSRVQNQRMLSEKVDLENTHTLMKLVPLKARVSVSFEIIFQN